MRTLLMSLALTAITLTGMAQKFGHINANELLMAMPERETAEKSIEEQATVYEQELRNMQTELQKKYEEYQTKAETWPEAIRKSKEKEIRQMEQGIQEFSQTAQQDLAKLEEDLLTPLIDSARAAIEEVGAENGFTYIFDISTGATLYNGGEDVMPLVKAKLGIE